MDKITFNHLSIVNQDSRTSKKEKPRMSEVDSLADLLVETYDNSQYRRWYCKIIYEFGISQVQEWFRRAKEGKEPAKLFTAYVNQARALRSTKYNFSRSGDET